MAPGAGWCWNSAPRRDARFSLPTSLPRCAKTPASRRPTTPSAPKTSRWCCRCRSAASSTILPRAARRSGRRIRRATTALFRAQQQTRRRRQARTRSPAPGRARAGARPVRPRPHQADAAIAADIAEDWIAAVGDAEAIGRFKSISEADMFDCEYWPLEQAKLGGARRAAARRPDRRDHRRRRRHRRRDRQGLRRSRRRSRAPRPRPRGGGRASDGDGAGRAAASPAT